MAVGAQLAAHVGCCAGNGQGEHDTRETDWLPALQRIASTAWLHATPHPLALGGFPATAAARGHHSEGTLLQSWDSSAPWAQLGMVCALFGRTASEVLVLTAARVVHMVQWAAPAGRQGHEGQEAAPTQPQGSGEVAKASLKVCNREGWGGVGAGRNGLRLWTMAAMEEGCTEARRGTTQHVCGVQPMTCRTPLRGRRCGPCWAPTALRPSPRAATVSPRRCSMTPSPPAFVPLCPLVQRAPPEQRQHSSVRGAAFDARRALLVVAGDGDGAAPDLAPTLSVWQLEGLHLRLLAASGRAAVCGGGWRAPTGGRWVLAG